MTTSDPPEGSRVGQEADEPNVSGRPPNYLVRRAIVVGAGVVLVAAVAVGIGALLDRGGESSPSGEAVAEWNSAVLLDSRTGQVVVTDTAGEESARFGSGVRAPADAIAVGPTMVVTSADTAAVVDLAGESTQAYDIVPPNAGVVMPAGSAATMIVGSSSGDRALLVHGPTGEVIDTSEFSSIAGAQYDVATSIAVRSGRDVLVTDAGNFQSVLFSFDRDEPSFFPGRALAVSDDLVVTTQNVGNESSISVFDHEGASINGARTAAVRGALITQDRIVLVTLEGDLLELDPSSGDVSSAGTTAIAPVQTAAVTTGTDRLVVVGEGGTSLVGDDGTVVAEFNGGVPIITGINEFATRTSTCLVLVDPDGGLVIASLGDGSIVAEASLPAGATNADVLTSADGCTAAVSSSDGALVIGESDVTTLDSPGELRSLSPDAAAVVIAADGRLELHTIAASEPAGSSGTDPAAGGPEVEGTDLGPDSRTVLFTER